MAKRKPAAKRATPKRVAVTGSFLEKLAAWTAIVDEVVRASTPAAVRKASTDVLDHLPIDLFDDDELDLAALNKAHVASNKKLEARIRALGDQRDMVHEVCKLRDLINDS